MIRSSEATQTRGKIVGNPDEIVGFVGGKVGRVGIENFRRIGQLSPGSYQPNNRLTATRKAVSRIAASE